MGRKTAKLEITGRLSSHNDEQDEIDQNRWQEFAADVRELAARPKYADLDIDISDMGSW